MFKKTHYKKKSIFLPFIIFRIILSLVMFLLLFGGLYSAYRHFSGVDLLNLDPKSLISGVTGLLPGNIAKFIPFNTNRTTDTQSNQDILSKVGLNTQSGQSSTSNAKEIFRFVLIADSHSDNLNLKKALSLAKNRDVKFLIGLGDYSEVGTLDELKAAKAAFDSSGIRYFLTPGDHDLWDSRNQGSVPSLNFTQTFGPAYQSFDYENFKFIILYNSDNYLGLGQKQNGWLNQELSKAKQEDLNILIFLHSPLSHPVSDHVMGKVEPKLHEEAKSLIKLFSEYGVKKVFAGDAHIFSEYSEPETKIDMVTVGAVTADRNLQLPRFAIVYVFADGTTKIEDVEIK